MRTRSIHKAALTDAVTPLEESGKKLAYKAAVEGIVLLENDGSLPLKAGKIALYGAGAKKTIKGGTGSGEVNERHAVSVFEGLEQSGFTVTTMRWIEDYDQTFEEGEQEYAEEFRKKLSPKNLSDFMNLMSSPYRYPYGRAIQEKDIEESDTDSCIYVVSRQAGEGADRKLDENEYGLSEIERINIAFCAERYKKLIVVINVGGVFDLNFLNEISGINAVIFMGELGTMGGLALADVISGKQTPSGKLTDTWAKHYRDLPFADEYSYLNGNLDEEYYREGIYVGYKYYETASDDGVINYEDVVKYPFGYGLSYTTFEQKMNDFSDNGDNVTFNVTVTNTGDVAGKDVVEVYFTPPYTNGGIEKASVNLIDYAKTGEIAPGESETVEFTINKEDMASYDANEIKVAGGGYILEAGEYTVSVRSDSHTVLDQATFTVDSDINYSESARTTDNVVATNQLNDYTAGNVTYLSRADGFANYAEATAAPAEEAYVMDDATRKEVEANSTAYYDSTAYDNAEDPMPTLGSDNGLTLADLTGKAYDDPMWDQLLDQMSFEDMSLLVNLGGWQTAQIDSVGKVATSDCDGPAGVNNFITGTYGTPYPTEVLMAQTWNTDLLYDLGLAMGQEYADVNNYGVYGPAMNTHRSAFAGRNFEYYSEDGVLAGKLAAAQVNAMATKGTYNYIKHFALNDQETNRCAFLLTYSNEQAIREIYLKPFELCIKNFDGTQIAVMSSFNWIGTVPACANEDTLTTILRNEWGFQGMVITDYDGSYGYMITDHCVRTGNDLMLGFSSQASNQLTNTESATLNNALRTSCKNIMYTIANSGYYTNTTDDSGMSNMTKLFVTIDVVTVLLVVLCMALVIVRYRKKHAKTTAEVTPEEKKEE